MQANHECAAGRRMLIDSQLNLRPLQRVPFTLICKHESTKILFGTDLASACFFVVSFCVPNF